MTVLALECWTFFTGMERNFCRNVTLVDAHTDLLNHIESFAAYDRVVLVDAILDPENKLGKPGQIVVLHEKEFLAWSEASSSVHQMSPMLSVKLFRQLYPAAQTQIVLTGLLVDQLTHALHYATDDRLGEAVMVIRASLL